MNHNNSMNNREEIERMLLARIVEQRRAASQPQQAPQQHQQPHPFLSLLSSSSTRRDAAALVPPLLAPSLSTNPSTSTDNLPLQLGGERLELARQLEYALLLQQQQQQQEQQLRLHQSLQNELLRMRHSAAESLLPAAVGTALTSTMLSNRGEEELLQQERQQQALLLDLIQAQRIQQAREEQAQNHHELNQQERQQACPAVSRVAASDGAAVATPSSLSIPALIELGKSLRKPKDPYMDLSKIPPVHHPRRKISTQEQEDGSRGNIKFFPEKLYDLLMRHSENENHEAASIVAFLPHGRVFMVYDVSRFESEIMPHEFKQSKWVSFTRQLSLYGFHRIHKGADEGGYYHELFLRGRVDLVRFMRRVGTPQSHQDRRKLRKPRPAPDFYRMEFLSGS